jgi:hypothetical protein
LGSGIDLTPRASPADLRSPSVRIYLDRPHLPQVDADTGVDHRGPGDAMTTAVHRQRQMLLAGHVHHRGNVARVATSGDERR